MRASPAPPGLHESAAVAPFAGYREVGISVGGRCVRVVVADTPARRARRVARRRPTSARTRGCCSSQSSDTDVAFTMSGVTTPLDVGWFSSGGTRLGSTRMRAVPGTEARCPQYRSPTAYRVALEAPAGSGTPGALAPCA